MAEGRTLLGGGVKYDGGKLRYDLIAPEALEGLAKVYTIGAKKYGDRNWENGIDFSRVYSALQRHAWVWWAGEEFDPDGQHHLDSVMWNAATLRAFIARGMSAHDDRPRIARPTDAEIAALGDDNR